MTPSPAMLPFRRPAESDLLVENWRVRLVGMTVQNRAFLGDPRETCSVCPSGECFAFEIQCGRWACSTVVEAR